MRSVNKLPQFQKNYRSALHIMIRQLKSRFPQTATGSFRYAQVGAAAATAAELLKAGNEP